jgi:hypothetical protein
MTGGGVGIECSQGDEGADDAINRGETEETETKK